jgi:Mor family transcriptional regulator
MGNRPKLKEKRNREIHSAFEAGSSLTQLSERYCLSVISLYEIIRQEVHRRALSPEGYYRQLREGQQL